LNIHQQEGCFLIDWLKHIIFSKMILLLNFLSSLKKKIIFFVIKELSNLEKQKTKKLYKFIKVDLSNDPPKFEINEFDSNLELFSLIKKNEAGNKEYERYFKLNKILNKNEEKRT
jgi:hypothetical protein